MAYEVSLVVAPCEGKLRWWQPFGPNFVARLARARGETITECQVYGPKLKLSFRRFMETEAVFLQTNTVVEYRPN